MAEHVKVLLTEEEVDRRIQAIGKQISKDYAGKQVHLVCVLKGGSFFMCELAKRITVPVSLDFMSVSSYGRDTKSSGVVKIVGRPGQAQEGQSRPRRRTGPAEAGQGGTGKAQRVFQKGGHRSRAGTQKIRRFAHRN